MANKARITKSVPVSIDEQMDVDVTLRVDEIVEFISNCKPSEKMQILAELKSEGDISIIGVDIKTLEDKCKAEALIQLFNKYTSSHLESLI